MAVKFTNNAFSTLASSINSSVTTISLAAGTGGRFPSLGAGDVFYATLVDASNNIEIVKCTARATDTLTVVRGQDNSTARSFAAGDRIELRPVAASLEALYADAVTYASTQTSTPLSNHLANASAAHAASAISFAATGNIAATNVQTAIAELDTEKVPTTRTLTAGTGLSGGGDLSDNRSLALANTAVVPGSYGSSSAIPNFTVNAQGQLTAAGSSAITFKTISLETAAASFGNDTTITFPSNTFLIIGTCYINTSGSSGGRMSVQFKNGSTVVQEMIVCGGNETNGTDGGSGMSVRSAFAIGVPSGATSVRIYNSSGGNGISGTVYQYLKYA